MPKHFTTQHVKQHPKPCSPNAFNDPNLVRTAQRVGGQASREGFQRRDAAQRSSSRKPAATTGQGSSKRVPFVRVEATSHKLRYPTAPKFVRKDGGQTPTYVVSRPSPEKHMAGELLGVGAGPTTYGIDVSTRCYMSLPTCNGRGR